MDINKLIEKLKNVSSPEMDFLNEIIETLEQQLTKISTSEEERSDVYNSLLGGLEREKELMAKLEKARVALKEIGKGAGYDTNWTESQSYFIASQALKEIWGMSDN